METNTDMYFSKSISANTDIATKEVIDNAAQNQSESERYNKQSNKNPKPQLPNTIFNAVVRIKKEEFSRKDLRTISNIVKRKFDKQFAGLEPDKILQQEENGKTYNVYCYPESMRKEIMRIANWFFKLKESKAIKHQRIIATETLSKLKKIGSPDYEKELVKFNITEEERRKQEKNNREKGKRQQQISNYPKRSMQINSKGEYKKYNNLGNNTDSKNKPRFNKRKFPPNSNIEAKKYDENNTSLPKENATDLYIDRIVNSAINNSKLSIDSNE
jgi:hypothetical protein